MVGEALWLYAQMVRWGQPASAAARHIAARVFRPELYRVHVGDGAAPQPVPQPFDDSGFDSADVASCLRSVPLDTPFVASTRAEH